MSNRTASPRLLVSVRNIAEARSAIDGGADIIDVKDPDGGSLGRADADVIAALASLPEFGPQGGQQFGNARLPLSVALGEVDEEVNTDAFSLPPTVAYAKLGVAHLRDDANWVDRWLGVRNAFDRRAGTSVGWIAVIYADAEQAQSPPAEQIIAAAVATGCVGVLVDTFSKTCGRLLDHTSPEVLARWARTVQCKRLMFAVAGRLSLRDLPQLAPVSPDVIAVRSAVCEEEDRLSSVRQDRVADFRRSMENDVTIAPALSATR